MLSYGGRLTLIKSVLGSLGTYYLSLFKAPVSVIKLIESLRASFFWGSNGEDRKMHWIKWDHILNSRKKGGLGVNSLRSLNLALIYKWRWRYVHFQDSLWVRVLIAIHGHQPNGYHPIVHVNSRGAWAHINRSIVLMHQRDLIPSPSMSMQLGNGSDINFWNDTWKDGVALSSRFPRLFALETEKNCSVAARFSNGSWVWKWRRIPRNGTESSQLLDLNFSLVNTQLSDVSDRWVWNEEASKLFSVSSARNLIHNAILPTGLRSTSWCKYVPIKINIFAWRLFLNRLPTKTNLVNRDIDVPNLLCSNCNQTPEEDHHIFIHCVTASQVWSKIAQWTSIDFSHCLLISDLEFWKSDTRFTGRKKIIIEVIILATVWNLWRLRNSTTFKDSSFRKSQIVDTIVLNSFEWLTSRYNRSRVDWNLWLQNPMLTL